ncbi:MAG: BMP family ABC transporter substrate-binding protein [Anaerolineales bacterium]|jgi:basic membrane protein A|nr:BMP family ABC transporter substrate-binding protein [Anaerolineales bacterium]
MKLVSRILIALMVLSVLLAACAPAAQQETKFKVGQVTDLGGIDDKSFNASAYAGIEDAVKQLDVDGKYLESQGQSDYAKNIQQFLDEDTDLIVTVGFLLGVDTALTAKANPDLKMAIVDYGFPDCWEGAVEGKDCGSATEMANVRGLGFQTDQASFLAGYLAAGMTKTGKVATYGGIPLPTVTIFMKGFEAGVKYYNQQKGTAVEVLGWNTAANDGAFTGNFESTDDGRNFATNFVQEGADIIMPVAGPVGLGSAAYCQETGSCMIIGVDADWFGTAPEYKSVLLTSVLKKIDVAVFDTIKDAKEGTFTGGNVTYTIADGGVDIAPFHELDGQVSAEMKSELATIKQALIDGSLTVDGVLGQ